MRRRRVPRPLGDAVRTAVSTAEPATPLAAVQTVWADAVGATIAAEATPVGERDGLVTVACRSATWAQELDLLGEEIAAKLRSRLPPETTLRGLRFQVGEDRS